MSAPGPVPAIRSGLDDLDEVLGGLFVGGRDADVRTKKTTAGAILCNLAIFIPSLPVIPTALRPVSTVCRKAPSANRPALFGTSRDVRPLGVDSDPR